MHSKWPLVKIDSIKSPTKYSCVGGPFGSSLSRKHYVEVPCVPVLRGVNLSGDQFNDCDFVYVSENKAKELHRNMAYPNDVVFTQRGTLGQVAIIPENARFSEYVVSQSQMKLTVNSDIAEPYFIYSYFRTPQAKKQIDTHAIVGGVPHINLGILKELEIPLPPLAIQKQISTLVRSIDNKIELNTQTNQTLEQMAQAIFKSWFVDFDPVKAKINGEQPEGMDAATASLFPEKLVDSEVGLIPEGWNVRSLEEVAGFQNGFAFYTTGYSDKGFSVVDLGNISTEGKFIQTSHDKYVSEEIYNLPKHQKHHLNKDDLVMAMTDMTQAMGILGKTGKITESDKYILNQRIGRIRCKPNIDVNFMLTNLNSKHQLHFLKVRALGTVQKYVNTNHIKEMGFVIPCDDLMQNFGDLVRPLFDRIYANDLQSLELANLRDTLLPKLLSGEIELGKCEDIVN